VVVHPDLLHEIATASARAGRCETGGPLLGTIQHSWDGPVPTPIVALLGTVAPGPDVDAHPARVALGRAGDGERAAAALRWLRSASGLDLQHVGDWHKHPAGHPHPSPGDRATARAMSRERGGAVWLVAVTVGERSARFGTEIDDEAIRRVADRSQVDEIRIYEADPQEGLVLSTVAVDGCALPRLPRLPWHLAQPGRFAAECRLLTAAGYAVSLKALLGSDGPVVELRLDHEDRGELSVVTGPGFPAEPPALRDGRGRLLPTLDHWSPARFLLDVVEERWRR
jgi:proteasome lid subunit RPN8/RPN11